MRSLSLAVVLLSAAGTAAAQQDGLTPTDILEAGNVSATAKLAISEGEATLGIGGTGVDVDISAFQLLLNAGVGLGEGFEIELAVPYQFTGDFEGTASGGGGSVKLDQESKGVGDLEIRGNYRLIEEDATSPQVVLGVVVVAPTGDDDEGTPEITTNPPSMLEQPGEEGGIGDGVWNYGFGVAISKRLQSFEPYAALQYVIGGEREENNVDEDKADILTLLVGTEFHVTEKATLDFRAIYERVGEEVTDDGFGLEEEEADHFRYGAQVQAYLRAGSNVTIIAGVGGFWTEDHDLDTNSLVLEDLEDNFLWQATLGVHLLFGP